MNTYILYHQEMSRCLAILKASSRDIYEITEGWNKSSPNKISSKDVYLQLSDLMETKPTFAIIDPNGAIIAYDLAIKWCNFDHEGRVTIEVMQIRKVKPLRGSGFAD